MATTRGRLVYNNQIVFDQADFFQLDGYTRVAGLSPAQVVCEVYYNNVIQAWPIVTGLSILDNQIASGRVYWDLLTSGAYGVRWRPNAVGYWRILITYPAGTQILAQDYDVGSGTGVAPPQGGLKTSFGGPHGC